MKSDRRLAAGRYIDWRRLRQSPQSQALSLISSMDALMSDKREQNSDVTLVDV
jgi:hypothetical protein